MEEGRILRRTEATMSLERPDGMEAMDADAQNEPLEFVMDPMMMGDDGEDEIMPVDVDDDWQNEPPSTLFQGGQRYQGQQFGQQAVQSHFAKPPPVNEVAVEDREEDELEEDHRMPDYKCSAFNKEFMRWHEVPALEGKPTKVPLTAPRVRMGPPGDHPSFHRAPLDSYLPLVAKDLRAVEGAERRIENEDGSVPKTRVTTTATNERLITQSEQLHESVNVNFSYQDLGDKYQKHNSMRVLKNLKAAVKINISNNFLSDISGCYWQCCREAYVGRNDFTSLKNLPMMPAIKLLSVEDCRIQTLDGLGRFTTLEVLKLDGNPVAFIPNYRQKVRNILPRLRLLDGRPMDRGLDPPPIDEGGCCIL